ncbi:mechanosensitive ion channel [Pseudodesulfovibrio sp.]|nr:mechanosensitive ion channel [Pseudodesulfovibrio sp.]
MNKRILCVFLSVFLLSLLIIPHAHAASAAMVKAVSGGGSAEAATEVTIPADATADQVREIMGSLTDEQVRALLIEELKKEAVPLPVPEEKGLPGLVKKTKAVTHFVKDRFEYLFSEASTAPRELPKRLSGILSGTGRLSASKLFIAIAVLSALWFIVIWLFKRKTAPARKSIASTPADAPWYVRMGRLFLRALLDLAGVILLTVAVLICYLTLFSEGAAGKPVLLAWLGAMIFLELVKVLTRFLLAPHAPTLRYLPLSDSVAQYLFSWTLRVARVIAVGLLVTTLIRLEGGSEALTLLVMTIFGFIVAMMLALVALWNKKPVAEALMARNEPETLLHQFAHVWHVGAITYFLGFWMFWVLALMVFGGKALLPGMVTLIIIPLYFLMDWATQQLVKFAVDMAGVEDMAESDQDEEHGKVAKITRFQSFLSKSFRTLVLAANVFFLLRVWGLNLVFGRELVHAGINILVTLILAYIFWIFINGLIERKIREKEEETGPMEAGEGGGGPGGDRFATLLQLVKKFIFSAIAVVTVLVILSSMGVDVGPLIAGASVFGIAIGFGAQTLVKDIISGIFFLMDDAFRVGDYIIVGSARGQVESISVRSFKLRHHNGPLFTIPFGGIKEVQNMTRDWAIMKLQYLVPFDTDIQQVKKIIKKINKEIRAIPELNEFMLDDIKSQGVKAMEEFGMRMRVKFMTKPGGQFTLRKLVLAKMRKEFEAAGIEFAKPRVSVHIPSETNLTPEEEAQVAAAASKAVENKDAESGKATR